MAFDNVQLKILAHPQWPGQGLYLIVIWLNSRKSDKDLLDLLKQTAPKAISYLSKCTVKDGKADF